MERPVLDAYDRRRIETLSTPMLFDELLGFASEVSFGHPLDLKPYEKPNIPEADIIGKLGVRGLRLALDLVNNNQYNSIFSGERTDTASEEEYIWIDSPMRDPAYYSDQPNLEILEKTRQFGEALLAEAYRGLGQDVYDKIRDFRAAETDDDQIKIISWLNQRLKDIAYTNHGLNLAYGDEETDGFYHPIRLSPQAIGVYPRHKLSPTCLGVSLIAASFFEQAEATHLHAGVMVSANQAIYRSVISLFDTIKAKLENGQEFVPDVLLTSLKDKRDSLVGRYLKDEGYHAVNMVRLASGQWCQVDSNLDATAVVPYDEYSLKLDHTYSDLTQFEAIAPGLESSVEFPLTSASSNVEEWVEAIDSRDINPTTIRDILINEVDSVPEKIKQTCIDPIFRQRPDGLTEIVNSNIDMILKHSFKDDAFYQLFSKYVLWGQPLLEVQQRCRNDPSFLDRRVQDVQNLPLVMAGSLAIKYEDAARINGPSRTHDLLEIGLASRRIGMAVLGDFATYCDNRLPPSFWVTHWPSYIPLTETLDGANRTSAQQVMASNNTGWLSSTYLSYAKADDIIYKFMDAQKKERQDAKS